MPRRRPRRNFAVRRANPSSPVPNSQDPALGTAGHLDVGLDRDHQLAVTTAHVEHVHPVGVEHRIGADTPGHARTTTTVRHVGVSLGRLLGRYRAWETPTLNPRYATPDRSPMLRSEEPVNAAPKSFSGSTAVIRLPAANPIGNSRMIAGMPNLDATI
jgi:hypothetical protein